jgi:DNA invertase Pin-like site-specific DNA recombinase
MTGEGAIKTKTANAVAYVRVSTQSQARSGLEGQRDAIAAFAKVEGFTITRTFEEHETGKGADAPSTAGRNSLPPSKQRESLVAR